MRTGDDVTASEMGKSALYVQINGCNVNTQAEENDAACTDWVGLD